MVQDSGEGQNADADEVIEVAARKIVFDKDTGEIVAVASAFQGLQQSSKPLSQFVSKLTGLTDEQLQGQKIDWQEFDSFIADAALDAGRRSAIPSDCVCGKQQVWYMAIVGANQRKKSNDFYSALD